MLSLKIFATVLIFTKSFAKFNHFAVANFTFQVALHLIWQLHGRNEAFEKWFTLMEKLYQWSLRFNELQSHIPIKCGPKSCWSFILQQAVLSQWKLCVVLHHINDNYEDWAIGCVTWNALVQVRPHASVPVYWRWSRWCSGDNTRRSHQSVARATQELHF